MFQKLKAQGVHLMASIMVNWIIYYMQVYYGLNIDRKNYITYLFSLQFAIAKGYTDFALCAEFTGQTRGTSPINI